MSVPLTELPPAVQAASESSNQLPEISKILIVYGPLGLLALIAIYAAIRLYRDRENDRKEFAKALQADREKCDKERIERQQEFDRALQAERDKSDKDRLERAEEHSKLEERHITKAETMNEKYYDLAKGIHQVLDSVVKRKGG